MTKGSKVCMEKEIIQLDEDKLSQMKEYYDQFPIGICIQKYLETEDHRGDFIPVYANDMFAIAMGVPKEYLFLVSLRNSSDRFETERLLELKSVALEGNVIEGETFSGDFSRYFTCHIRQYCYGYTITFLNDVTSVHVTARTLKSVSTSYEEIYYVRLEMSGCKQVYSSKQEELRTMKFEELRTKLLDQPKVHDSEYCEMSDFLKLENFEVCLINDEYVSRRYRKQQEDGSYRWLLITVIVNERLNQKPVGYTITVKDINDLVLERAQKEEELEEAYIKAKKANESKDKFLKNMSHDLRTPINGILGLIGMLESDGISNDVKKEYLSKIRSSTENLLSLFNEVLEITRLDADGIRFANQSVNMDDVAYQLEQFMSKQQAKLKLTMDVTHKMRFGAEEYLRQIIYQLLNNSIKFNLNNHPIEVMIREIADTDLVQMTVKDYGIGIGKDFAPHVFEPFSQEYGDSRTTYEGSGLGLTYVKRIVDELKGSISFESKPREGCTFTVEIPLEIDWQKHDESRMEEMQNLAGRKVLVVEDNEINMMIIECFLVAEGLLVEKAENGRIAVEKFIMSREGEYEFILMDIMMPIMDGLEATKVIRMANRADAKTIPIIAVSANSFPEDIKKGMDAGMTDYLSKPVNKNILIQTLRHSITQ